MVNVRVQVMTQISFLFIRFNPVQYITQLSESEEANNESVFVKDGGEDTRTFVKMVLSAWILTVNDVPRVPQNVCPQPTTSYCRKYVIWQLTSKSYKHLTTTCTRPLLHTFSRNLPQFVRCFNTTSNNGGNDNEKASS